MILNPFGSGSSRLGMKFLLAALLVSFLLCSCSPGLGNTIKVDMVKTEGLAGSEALLSGVKLKLEPVEDSRAQTAVVTINGRSVQPESPLASQVENAAKAVLRDSGAAFGQLSKGSLTLKLMEWRAHVTPGFPTSKAESRCTLKAVLTESGTGRQVFAATYSGATSFEHPFLREVLIEEVLGDALGQSLSEMVRDRSFVDAARQAGLPAGRAP